MAKKGTYKYNTRSRVNCVTKFNNTPKMRLILHFSHRPQKYIQSQWNHYQTTLTVKPQKILGYRDLVNMDVLVWTNSMRNELGRLSQSWK